MITAELLDALLSAHGRQAESHLESMTSDDRARGFLEYLISSQRNADNDARCILASVLLRRDLAGLAASLLLEMAKPLISLYTSCDQIKRQIGFCLAELCASLSVSSPVGAQNVLKEILQQISPMCLRGDSKALQCVANIAERAPLVVKTLVPELLQLFAAATPACTSPSATSALVEAVCFSGVSTEQTSLLPIPMTNSVSLNPNSDSVQFGRLLLPFMMDHNQNLSNDTLYHLIHTAGTCPSVLAADFQVLSAVVQACVNTAKTNSNESTRLAALELLASLVSVGDVKRKIVNTAQGTAIRQEIQTVLTVCAELCVNGVDSDLDEWAAEEASLLEDIFADDTAAHAEALLGSLLQHVGGSLSVVLPLVETLLVSSEWQQHRAALAVLNQCLSANPVSFRPHLGVALDAALCMTESPVERVRFEALTLLGTLCEDATLKQEQGGRILQAVTKSIPSPNTKVAALSCLVIVQYCRAGRDDMDAETAVTPYLRDLLTSLVAGALSAHVVSGNSVHSGLLVVQVRAIGAVACLAEASQDAFFPFYTDVLPGLFARAEIPSDNAEIAQLRGSAIEAITIIGEALGEAHRDVYALDAERVLHIALPLLHSRSSAIPMDQLLAACARVASVMQEQYTPFANQVLPHLLARLKEQVDVEFVAGDEAGLEATKRGDMEMVDGVESMTVALPGKGLTKLSINTEQIEQKEHACRAVYEHAVALGGGFGPFCTVTLEALFPLLTFKYSADVRSTASQAASIVFDSACQSEESIGLAARYLPVLSSTICKQMMSENPEDTEVYYALAEALSDTLFFAYRTISSSNRSILAKFTFNEADSIVKLLMPLMTSCLQRRMNIIEIVEGRSGALSGEDERNDLMRALENEQQILTPLVDSVGYCLKFLKDAFLPIFAKEVAPALGPHLKTSLDSRARYAATCLFDDVVEHCGPGGASQYGSQLAEGAMIGITNQSDEDVQQVSLYGLAQIARYCPASTLEGGAQSIISTLLPIAGTSKESVENVFIVENAVSALASLALFKNAPLQQLKTVDKTQLMSTFVNQLPLQEDEDEAKICHAGFCDLVQEGSIPLVASAPEILRVIGETAVCIREEEQDLASPETQERFGQILMQMQASVPADSMNAAFSAISPEAQMGVNALMEQFGQSN